VAVGNPAVATSTTAGSEIIIEANFRLKRIISILLLYSILMGNELLGCIVMLSAEIVLNYIKQARWCQENPFAPAST
jgi:hypothetical protein